MLMPANPLSERAHLCEVCMKPVDPMARYQHVVGAVAWRGHKDCVLTIPAPAPTPSHPLHFDMPGCITHLHGNKWWCRKCHREVERQFREVCHALWEMQGAGERIVR